MLRIYKRGPVYWVRGVVNRIAIRETTRCRDARAAELYARRRERELADPDHAAAHQATVATALSRFLRELAREGKAPGTVNMYECKAGHLVRLMGSRRLADLRRDDVLRYIEQREAETAHSHTIHREITTLRRALRSAGGAGEFSRDVKAVLPRYAAGYVPRTRWLTEEELYGVIAHLEPARGAVLAYAVATGGDRGPLFLARRSDVGPETIRVPGTKTGNRYRTIPRLSLFEPLIAFALKHGDGEGGLLFRPWTNVQRDLTAACVRAGVERFTLRDLRRTTATWLVRRGVALNLVAKILGHANTNMLQRVYGQLDAAAVGALIEDRIAVPLVSRDTADQADKDDAAEREFPGKA